MADRHTVSCGRYFIPPHGQRHSVWEGVWSTDDDYAWYIGHNSAVHQLGDPEDDASLLRTRLFPETITFYCQGSTIAEGRNAKTNPLIWSGSEPDVVLDCTRGDSSILYKYFRRVCFLESIDTEDPQRRAEFDKQPAYGSGATFRWDDRDKVVAACIDPLRATDGSGQLVAKGEEDDDDGKPEEPVTDHSAEPHSRESGNMPSVNAITRGQWSSFPGTLTIGDVSVPATVSVLLRPAKSMVHPNFVL